MRQAGKNLAIEFPHSTGMEGPLTHYQYDTFKMNPSLNWVEPAYVTFSIGADGNATLTVFDAMGRQVATLVDGPLKAGSYAVSWDASSAPSGVYQYRLESGGWSAVGRMILTK